MGGRRGGGLKREEIHVYIKLIQFVVHQKLMQHFKAIILQLGGGLGDWGIGECARQPGCVHWRGGRGGLGGAALDAEFCSASPVTTSSSAREGAWSRRGQRRTRKWRTRKWRQHTVPRAPCGCWVPIPWGGTKAAVSAGQRPVAW